MSLINLNEAQEAVPRPPLRFLDDIPVEIRDKIYGYVLGSSTGEVALYVFGTEKRRIGIFEHDQEAEDQVLRNCTLQDPFAAMRSPSTRIELGLTLTCKKIRAETMGLFWKLNALYTSCDQEDPTRFCIRDLSRPYKLIKDIPLK